VAAPCGPVADPACETSTARASLRARGPDDAAGIPHPAFCGSVSASHRAADWRVLLFTSASVACQEGPRALCAQRHCARSKVFPSRELIDRAAAIVSMLARKIPGHKSAQRRGLRRSQHAALLFSANAFHEVVAASPVVRPYRRPPPRLATARAPMQTSRRAAILLVVPAPPTHRTAKASHPVGQVCPQRLC